LFTFLLLLSPINQLVMNAISTLPQPSFNKYWNTYTYFINGFCVEKHGTDTGFFICGNYTADGLPRCIESEQDLIAFVNNPCNLSEIKALTISY
jgi:hypothetical protein